MKCLINYFQVNSKTSLICFCLLQTLYNNSEDTHWERFISLPGRRRDQYSLVKILQYTCLSLQSCHTDKLQFRHITTDFLLHIYPPKLFQFNCVARQGSKINISDHSSPQWIWYLTIYRTAIIPPFKFLK